MTNLWKINGVDIYSTYGAAILRGSYVDLLTPPTPKKRLEHDYIDQNGVAVDTTSTLTYEAKRFNIKIALKASSATEFWSRYNALFAVLAVPGTFTLWIADLNKTYTLLYEGCSKVEKLTRITGSTFVYATFELKLLQPNPLF